MTTVLPLTAAYRFGREKGLDAEITRIEPSSAASAESAMRPDSNFRRAEIVVLFQNNGIFEEFKVAHWPEGNTPIGAREVRKYLAQKQRYDDLLRAVENDASEPDEQENEAEERQSFAAERDLRDFMAKNLDLIEKGLRLYEADGRDGVEFHIDDGKGRIDLLAIDLRGGLVVIEFKLYQGRNKTLGQILYYMGWVDRHLPNPPCRGVIVAKDITDDLVLAVRRAQGVTLFSYNLSVSLVAVAV